MWSSVDYFFTQAVKTYIFLVEDTMTWNFFLLSLFVSFGIVLVTMVYLRGELSEKRSLDSVDSIAQEGHESFSACYENLEDIDGPSEPHNPCVEIQNTEQCTESTERAFNMNDLSDHQGPNLGTSSKTDNEEILYHSEELQSLKEVLEGVIIPSRRLNVTSCPIGIASKKSELNLKRHDIKVYPDGIYMDDLKRFYDASRGNLKKAATRLVETSIFRGERFPIDLASCQEELQKNQCFVQGKDIDSNPVVYFRVKCPGPWEKNIDSITSATLYQIETMLKNEFTSCHYYSSKKITLVVWTGIPLTNRDEQNTQNSDPPKETKIEKDVKYHNHCDLSVAQHLINLFLTHYPERLSRALIMPSLELGLDAICLNVSLRALISSSRVRRKVTIMKDAEELKEFIHEDQLIEVCGGKAPVINVFAKH